MPIDWGRCKQTDFTKVKIVKQRCYMRKRNPLTSYDEFRFEDLWAVEDEHGVVIAGGKSQRFMQSDVPEFRLKRDAKAFIERRLRT
jgi:hypothetical protein